MKNFVLMTRGRTGSTAVIDELRKVEGLCATSELFMVYDFKQVPKHHFDVILPFVLWKKEKFLRRLTTDRLNATNYLKEAEEKAEARGSSRFIFKLLSNHFSRWPFLDNVLKERNYKAVYLSRSISRQVVSFWVAKQRGVWNVKEARWKKNREEYENFQPVYFEPADFRSQVQIWQRDQDADLQKLVDDKYDHIHVTYEEFLSDRALFYEKVFAFLGLPAGNPPRSDFSVMIKDLRDTIENYDEIAKIAVELGSPLE